MIDANAIFMGTRAKTECYIDIEKLTKNILTGKKSRKNILAEFGVMANIVRSFCDYNFISFYQKYKQDWESYIHPVIRDLVTFSLTTREREIFYKNYIMRIANTEMEHYDMGNLYSVTRKIFDNLMFFYENENDILN